MNSTEVIVWLRPRGVTDAADRDLLALAVAEASGLPPGQVVIEQRCSHCGGPHGRPVVAGPADGVGRQLYVSLSRAGEFVAVAVTKAGPVGIDLESIAAVARAGVDEVAFSPAELLALGSLDAGAAASARTRLWTGKEAVLKAVGTGLRTDLRDVSLRLPLHTVQVAAGTGDGTDTDTGTTAQLMEFEAGAGYAGTVAVLAEIRPQLTFR